MSSVAGEQLLEFLADGRVAGLDVALRLEACLEAWDSVGGGTGRTGLVAASDPALFLAAFAAGWARGGRLVLANPGWGAQEWEEAARRLKPDLVFGAVPDVAWGGQADPAPRGSGPTVAVPTGGSGGRVRFAVHDAATLGAATAGFQAAFGGGPLVCVSGLPLFHVSGLMPFLRAAASGGRLVWHAAGGERPVAGPGEASVISLVPTQLARLLREPESVEALKCFSAVLVGGGPLPEALRRESRDRGLPLTPSYGMTETAAAVRMVRPEAFLDGDDSSGRDLPHARVTADPSGRIHVESESLFRGYLGDDTPPSAPWPTGDLGFLDSRGGLVVTGRIRELINSGGEKIDPGEVEAALVATGIAREARVLPRSDPEWGEVAVAVLVPGEAGHSDETRKARLRTCLAAHKAPRDWIAVDELPRTPQGKIDTATLRRMVRAAKETGRGDG